MAAELPRPGVEILQVFRSVSPTVITPTLVPCVVGVCKQVVEVLNTTASGSHELNSQALITLPGFFIAQAAAGTPPKYTGLDGLILALSINNGTTVSVTFSDPTAAGLSPTSIVSQILAAFRAAGVTAATAETVGDDTFQLRTVGKGEFQTIKVVSTTDPTVLSTFAIAANKVYQGVGSYDQHKITVPPESFPDPRNNLSQLAIENDTIRVFLAVGGTQLRELLRTESFLQNGGTESAAVLTGTADLTAITYATRAVVTGTADITSAGLYGGGGTLNGLTLIMNVNGAGNATLTFNGATNSASEAAMLAAIGSTFSGVTATQGGSGGNKLVLTDSVYGAGSTIVISGSSTALVALGLSAGTTSGTAGDLDGLTATLAIDGGSNVITTFTPPPNNTAAVLSLFNTAFGSSATATLDGSNFLVVTSATTGADSEVKVISGTGAALTTLGLTAATDVFGVAAVSAIDDGNGDQLTPLVKLNGATLTTAGAAAVVAGTVDITSVGLYGGGGTLAGKTLTLSDGKLPQTYTFPTVGSALANQAALLTALNGFFGTAAGGGFVFTQGGSGGNKLVITTTSLGVEGLVDIVSGTAVATLGLTVGKTRGTPFPPASGDELWAAGELLGVITQVAPGGIVTTVKLDRQIPIDKDLGASWYIIAKSLSGAQTASRPSADLIVDVTGSLVLKHEVLRDTTGTVISGKAQIYLQYRAVREDVTSLAKTPGLLRFDSTTAIESAIAPISVENPLALGAYFAAINAPSVQITALGVDSVTADSPYGTVEAFTRAAEFLEGFEVYALAPLTHDESVGQVLLTHVASMSAAENKGERICLFNPAQPTTKPNTIVASGVSGNSVPSSATQFDTGVLNLPALLLNAGVDPTGTIAVGDGVFLDIASDAKRYSVQSVSGSIVTIRTTFSAGENDDAFYATTDLNDPPLVSPLIDEAFAIRVRGASLTNVDGSLNKTGIAETYAGQASAYLNRRFWQIVADKCNATIGGLEQQLEGFYLNAGIAGMIGQQPPQQSFSNFPMTGYTAVKGTNDTFNERQLNQIAAGGNYIIVQDVQGAPLIARMALTTDRTSIEARTDSIVKVVDFTAKFLRKGLKNFIGRFNITQGFMDSLGAVIQGLLGFLVETGVLIGASLNNIMQDEDAPDTVLVDVTLDPPYPCNYIRLTLVV